MNFDFETPVARDNTDSQKWQKYAGRDVLPMWVADMDFKSSPAILDALHDRIEHGVFGYARPTQSTMDTMVSAMKERYDWTVDPSWFVWLPGLVCGLNVTAQAFAETGDEVLTLSPIYPPFITAPKNSARVSVSVPLVLDNQCWVIDWDALENAVTERTKLFLLCNPHNPVARVWTRDELARIGEFCVSHDLVLCSDEIHCDLILDDGPHIPAGLISEEIAKRTITLMAPSKTYNIPGLGTSFAIIPDGVLRRKFVRATSGIVAEVNALGYAACEAAYGKSEEWRQGLLNVLRGNRDRLLEFIASDLPGITMDAPMQATYLAWLNVRELGLKDPITHFENHGVGLTDGAFFGAKSGDYVRINLGCTRAMLEEALVRMKKAVSAI